MASELTRIKLATNLLLKGETMGVVKLAVDATNPVALPSAGHVPFGAVAHEYRVS